jgi:hypothetical protein
MILSDHLANGAGFVNWIAQNWAEALGLVLFPPKDGFAEHLLNPKHQATCATASYDCLFSFRNMPFHGLLDWRLAIGMLRSLKDGTYQSGLDGDFNEPELSGWPDYAAVLRDSFCQQFDLEPVNFEGLSGIHVGGRNVLVVHPLWGQFGAEGPRGIFADSVASASESEVRFIDTFNLARRPTWCYQRMMAST